MVKRKIIWSHQAKIDQFEILDYYHKRNGNKTYSQKLFRKFRNAIKLLIKHPEIGIRTDIHQIRSLFVEDYAIFYRLSEEIIEIVSIWDCRQDPDKINIK